MRDEIKLILLGCLANRNEKENERLNKLLVSSEDWAFIIGELIRHRINGNFYRSLLPEQKKYIIGNVSQTLSLMREINIIIQKMEYYLRLFMAKQNYCSIQ